MKKKGNLEPKPDFTIIFFVVLLFVTLIICPLTHHTRANSQGVKVVAGDIEVKH